LLATGWIAARLIAAEAAILCRANWRRQGRYALGDIAPRAALAAAQVMASERIAGFEVMVEV
jgi:predicted exporter